MISKELLSCGNHKLGTIKSFNIPALITCAGKSLWCEKYCYAHKRQYSYPNVISKYADNLRRAMREDFADVMNRELRNIKGDVIRIHASGDFFNRQYIESWLKIVRANRNKMFYAYTRAYRIPSLLAKLKELAYEQNFKMFLSIDPTIPMEEYNYLMFSKASIEGEGMLCKAQHQNNMTCFKCGICFDNKIKVDISFKKH
jgi:hypothetical protein